MTAAERIRLKQAVDARRRERELWQDAKGNWRLGVAGRHWKPSTVAVKA